MKTKILLLLILSSISITGFSKVWEIGNAGNTFTPDTIKINVGDTVNFTIGSFHNAVEVDSKTWSDNGNTPLEGGFNVPFNGGMVYPDQLKEGTLYFICSPHVQFGMKGVIIVEEVTTDIREEFAVADIAVYPNPTSDLVNVKAGIDLIGSVYIITDLSGRAVLTGDIREENTSLDIGYLSNGLYFIQVGVKPENKFKIVKN